VTFTALDARRRGPAEYHETAVIDAISTVYDPEIR